MKGEIKKSLLLLTQTPSNKNGPVLLSNNSVMMQVLHLLSLKYTLV